MSTGSPTSRAASASTSTRYVGFNLVYDGVGDVLHGIVGATAGTNYGENNSLMAITRNYSGPALFAAGVICILLAFVGKLSAFVGTIPVFVSGGLALYLFGVVGMQGIALMQENKVDLFDPLTAGGRRHHHGHRHRRQYRLRGRLPADQDPRRLPERVAGDRHRRGGRDRAEPRVPGAQSVHADQTDTARLTRGTCETPIRSDNQASLPSRRTPNEFRRA